ncbi:hypothetical protein Ancab_026450 [Ancistrocladus abbreviatus]
MKKIKVPSLLKRIMAALSSKTDELRTRIMIFFLLRNRAVLMDSVSDKLQALVGGGHHHRQPHGRHHKKDDDSQEETKALVTHSAAASQLITAEKEAEIVVNAASADVLDFDRVGGEVTEEDMYPNLTHNLLKESEEEIELTEEDDDGYTSQFGQQRIPEERGSSGGKSDDMTLEEDIDQAADLFIERFRRQIQLQKQESFDQRQQKMQSNV